MLQATTPRFPIDPATKDGSGLPWALVARPLLGLESQKSDGASAGETTVAEIARCDSCGSYISGLCRMNSQYWQCFLCEKRCKLPERYIDVVRNATPEELQKFPELGDDTCDVNVDTFAEAIEIPPVAYIFIVDGTVEVSSLETFSYAIGEALKVVKGDALFGVVVYTDEISFLDMRAKGAFRVVPSAMEEGFAPRAFAPDQWLRTTATEEVAENCSRCLSWFRSTPYVSPEKKRNAFISALCSSLDMLDAGECSAARISVITSPHSHDTAAPNGSKATEGNGIPSKIAKVKNSIVNAEEAVVMELTQRAFALGAMVDFYCSANLALGAAEALSLVKGTGGHLSLYEDTARNLTKNLVTTLKKPFAVHGITRVRTSPEMRINEALGFTVIPHVEIRDVYETAEHGVDSTMVLDLEYTSAEGFQAVNSRPAVQFAYRCTFVQPGRLPRHLLRICSKVFRVSSSRNIIRKEAHANVISLVLFRKALGICDTLTADDSRLRLRQWLSNLLAKCARPSDSDGMLQVDSTFGKLASLQKLPEYIHGLCRCRVLSTFAEANVEDAALRFKWERFDMNQLSVAVSPQLFSFKNHNEQSEGIRRPSFAEVTNCDDPIFLLNAQWIIVVYFKSSAAKRNIPYPPPLESAVTTLQNAIIKNSSSVPQVAVGREGTPGEVLFRSLLVLDANETQNKGGDSYKKFLQEVAEDGKLLLSGS